MANTTRGEAEISITNGKTYTLVFTTNVLADAEENDPNRSLWQTIQTLQEHQVRFSDLRWLVWLALRTHHADMTLADVGELCDTVGHQAAVEGVMKAVNAMFAKSPRKATATRTRRQKSGQTSLSTPLPPASIQTASGDARREKSH